MQSHRDLLLSARTRHRCLCLKSSCTSSLKAPQLWWFGNRQNLECFVSKQAADCVHLVRWLPMLDSKTVYRCAMYLLSPSPHKLHCSLAFFEMFSRFLQSRRCYSHRQVLECSRRLGFTSTDRKLCKIRRWTPSWQLWTMLAYTPLCKFWLSGFTWCSGTYLIDFSRLLSSSRFRNLCRICRRYFRCTQSNFSLH